jgi:protein subunit release factor B
MEFKVRPEKIKNLRERMEALGVREEDIVEKFIRSQGPGGQHVNKTSTCVYLKHVPTGIEIKCQESRSQLLNRFLARRLLVERVEETLCGKKSSREKNRDKIRKQKMKRRKRARTKALLEKEG